MNRIVVIFSLIILVFGAILAYQLKVFSVGVFDQATLPDTKLYPVILNKRQLYVKLADTPDKQQRGLSGTASLPQNQGVLFLFSKDGFYPFWMKGMNYSLDIIWLDSKGSVIYVARNVSPASYPRSYVSDKPARIVLEVNAGFAEANNVKIGDVMQY